MIPNPVHQPVLRKETIENLANSSPKLKLKNSDLRKSIEAVAKSKIIIDKDKHVKRSALSPKNRPPLEMFNNKTNRNLTQRYGPLS